MAQNIFMVLLAFVFLSALSVVSSEEICFDDLGCFSNDAPYDSLPAFPPFSPSVVNVQYYLFTRLNKDIWMKVSRTDPESLALFQPQLKTIVYVHGWNNPGYRSTFANRLKDALLEKENCNVFLADWTGGGTGLYGQSVQNARVAGREIGFFLQFLHDQTSLEYSQIHLIGSSLGAHTAGYAGESTPGVGRISGLDPAGPYFRSFLNPATRLDPTDAEFVDVIHTDGEVLIKLGLGMLQPTGDIDFYPNGGKEQPGCPKNATDYIEGRFAGTGCSHNRAPLLFLDSLETTTCESIGYSCSSWENFQSGSCTECGMLGCPVMGYNADQSRARGRFFLETGSTSPYCILDE